MVRADATSFVQRSAPVNSACAEDPFPSDCSVCLRRRSSVRVQFSEPRRRGCSAVHPAGSLERMLPCPAADARRGRSESPQSDNCGGRPGYADCAAADISPMLPCFPLPVCGDVDAAFPVHLHVHSTNCATSRSSTARESTRSSLTSARRTTKATSLGLLLMLVATSVTSVVGLPVQPRAPIADSKVFDGNPNDPVLDGTTYLMTFGYLPSSDMETGALRSEAELQRAIRHFQRVANIRQTGKLDADTMTAMQRPRCGMADLLETGRWTPNEYTDGGSRHRHGHGTDSARYGRPQEYAFGPSKWEKTHLTYRILNFTPDIKVHEIREAIRQAFTVWSDATQLSFHEVHSGTADIALEFASGYHHDGYPFDGPGVVLAHAFFPGDGRGGDVHFDEDETWTVRSETGVNLLMVAAHELGHALGLAHSTVPGSLMYPWHQGYSPDFMLPYDDTIAIQQLYGGRTRPAVTQPAVRPTMPTVRPTVPYVRPTVPSRTFPAVPTRPGRPTTTTRSTTTTKLTTTRSATSRIVTRRPYVPVTVKTVADVDPLPSECLTDFDAISLIRGEIFAFKGKWFWRITDSGVMGGHPVETSRFWYGLPSDLSHIDAVFERSGDGHIVFFSGSKYWELSGNERYPVVGRPLTDLSLPWDIERIDAAFVWGHNRRTYLISGNMYWKMTEYGQAVETHSYPRDMSMWAGIPVPVDSAFTHANGRTYFFKGLEYWEFNNARMHIQRGFPQPIGPRWLNCTESFDIPSDPPSSGRSTYSNSRMSLLSILIALAYRMLP